MCSKLETLETFYNKIDLSLSAESHNHVLGDGKDEQVKKLSCSDLLSRTILVKENDDSSSQKKGKQCYLSPTDVLIRTT